MSDQLRLFAGRNVETPRGIVEPHLASADVELAARVPSFVRFGTCSWSFSGWKDIVWKGAPTETALARHGLEAYARHPLFRAVSLDRAYYAPLRAEELREYAAQLAVARESTPTLSRFRVVSKVWDELTTAVYPRHPRYGARAGSRNPNFLDAARVRSEVLHPYSEAFAEDAGPFVFELTPMPPGTFDERTFVARVDGFISQLPTTFRYAFEIRNADLFGTRWLDMLAANRVAHSFTFWTAMPPLREQLRAFAKRSGRGPAFGVVRLMLPPYTRYEARKTSFAPFDKVVEPHVEMREDVIAILRMLAEQGCKACFVLANNKAEGSAPLTIRALAEMTANVFAR